MIHNLEAHAHGINLAQVDSLYNTSAHDGIVVVQVDNNCDYNGSANGNGSDISQANTSATECGSEVVQVVHCFNPTSFRGEGPLVVNSSRGVKRKRS